MGTILYNIIIVPISVLLEFFYQLLFEVTGSAGISIIGLSFVVTLCCLPLYIVAEKWQETERHIQKEMKTEVDRIKLSFHGDEQYMILSTYYRQHHYHPIMALRSSFSLLIQIPFFIAAYIYLSNLGPLKEHSFLFLRNLGAQDALFYIGSFPVNILPIAMTLINCISGAVYSRGHPLSEKIQIFGCAAFFLVFLYTSPAGLVLYWTMNNVLSLVKNIFYKLKKPGKVLHILLCIVSAAGICVSVFILKETKVSYRAAITVFCVVLPVIPFIYRAADKSLQKHFLLLDSQPRYRLSLFVLSSVILVFIAGITIPSFIMESEPELYCYIDGGTSPFPFILITFCKALGFFAFWPVCFYGLFSSKIKKLFSVLFPILAFSAIVNCFAFSGSYGPMTPDLRFMQEQTFNTTIRSLILNIFSLLSVVILSCLLISKAPYFFRSVCVIFLLALFGISIKNISFIAQSFSKMDPPVVSKKIDPVYHLSKTNKNVIVVMLDRAVAPFIPEALKERPDLKKDFDGFIWYSNTISLGKCTMTGTPGLFGGYDYTPFQSNLQTEKTVREKHNESILTMPSIFLKNGFTATVSDLPYENYSVQPVSDMYKKYPDIKRVQIHGAYSDYWYEHNGIKKMPYMSTRIKRNLIYFSFFKIVSPWLRRIVYHNNYWLSYDSMENFTTFVNSYSSLDYLPELTASDSSKGAFMLIDNETVHEPVFLQAPDYVPAQKVTDYGTGRFAHDPQYHVMISALLRFASFFDYLKKNNIYDNTRIIIVSDHGMSEKTGYFDNNLPLTKEDFIATLLFKDFNVRGELQNDMTFMTNADTPYLATKDIVPDAENPFTGNPLQVKNKAPLIKMDTAGFESTRIRNDTGYDVQDDEWYGVRDSIFVDSSWYKWSEKEIQEEKNKK